MERRKQFKLLSVMLAAVTLMALLAGCAPVAPAAPAPAQPAATSAAGQAAPAATAASGAPATGNQPVELSFWWWAESDAPGADKWLQETIAAYQKLHPNITVKMVPQSTDTLISAFTAAASAKSGPDLASQWATIPVLSQVWAGAVTPISDLVPADEIKHWANTNENMYNGKLWAAPLYLMGIPLAYNKDLFKKAGLDPENPPKTWDDFLKACDTLKKAGITPMAGGAAKASAFGAWTFAILGVQDLDSVDDIKAAAVGDVPFTSEKYTRWLTAIEDMLKKGYFNDNIASLDYPTAQDLFPQGKVAMSWGTDGNVLAWAKTLGADKVGVDQDADLRQGQTGHGLRRDAVYQLLRHVLVEASARKPLISWSSCTRPDRLRCVVQGHRRRACG